MTIKILRLPDVKLQSGLPRSTIYQRMAAGLWPKPISLGARSVGWPENEIQTIINAHVTNQNADQIKKLVNQIHQSRANAFSLQGDSHA